MIDFEEDEKIRQAAFDHLRRLAETSPFLTSADLAEGFAFYGDRIPLVNPQRGIFKPRNMRFLLSIRTVFPRVGRKVWYDDQREVHAQIFNEIESIDYSFMGDNPDAADNRWLREAMSFQIPIVYFLGIAPSKYQAIFPTFVVDWDAATLKSRIAFGLPDQQATGFSESATERRYALRTVKQRLHQASFREAVIDAYGGRCAISGLPEPLLLDAAHIIRDSDEQLGQPHVSNGLPLSKLHHVAFDSHLIGIDQDCKIHVSRRLLLNNDGPVLEALKGVHSSLLRPPTRPIDSPDRDRLSVRFKEFSARQ